MNRLNEIKVVVGHTERAIRKLNEIGINSRRLKAAHLLLLRAGSQLDWEMSNIRRENES